jgi:hypothetical protein
VGSVIQANVLAAQANTKGASGSNKKESGEPHGKKSKGNNGASASGGAPATLTPMILNPSGSKERRTRSVIFVMETIRRNRVQKRLMNRLRSVKKRNNARRVGRKTTPLKIARVKSDVLAALIPTSPTLGDTTLLYVSSSMVTPRVISKTKMGKNAKTIRVNRPQDHHPRKRTLRILPRVRKMNQAISLTMQSWRYFSCF